MLNTQEYRDAVAYKGDAPIFTVAYDWQDKPHRLVYDLCDEVDALRAQVAMLTAILRDIADCEGCEGCEHIPADALAGLERQRKLAAAEKLDEQRALIEDSKEGIREGIREDWSGPKCAGYLEAMDDIAEGLRMNAAQLRQEAGT